MAAPLCIRIDHPKCESKEDGRCYIWDCKSIKQSLPLDKATPAFTAMKLLAGLEVQYPKEDLEAF